MPKRCLNEDAKRNKPLDSSLTSEEVVQLRALAKGAELRFTAFVRETVLAADLSDEPPITRRRCSPGRRGQRRQVYFTFAEREAVRSKAHAAGMTASDYIYRALVRLLPEPTKKSFQAAATALPAGDNRLSPLPQNRVADLEAAQLETVIQLERLTKEMNAVGVNINQLAHAANASKILPGLWEEAKAKLDHRLAQADTVLTEVASRYVSNHS